MGLTIITKRSGRDRQSRPRSSGILDLLDNASSRLVQHQSRRYIVGGVTLNTPTQVERYCEDHGINPDRLQVKPQVIPQEGRKARIDVHLEPGR